MAELAQHGAAFVLAVATAVFPSFVHYVQFVPAAFRVALFHAFAFGLPSYLVLRSIGCFKVTRYEISAAP